MPISVSYTHLSPTLGIAGESPQHSEDLQRKARPEGERPNNQEYFPIEAYGKDSTSVVIKVNKIFDGSEKSFNDIYKEIALGGSVKKDLSKILGVKVFPKNVVVKALMRSEERR